MSKPSGTVLIVDDDVAVGDVLAALLSQEGYETRTATSGEDAREFLRTEPADVVITDVQMPGMSGLELFGRVTAPWPDLPVIVLTAHGTVQRAIEAMKAGAQE